MQLELQSEKQVLYIKWAVTLMVICPITHLNCEKIKIMPSEREEKNCEVMIIKYFRKICWIFHKSYWQNYPKKEQ